LLRLDNRNCLSTLGLLRKSDGLELLKISDVSVDVQVAGQFHPQVALLTVLFLVNLDNADERLILYLGVVVEDHVEILINCAESLREHLVE
jgi:hypothetical protein